MHTSGQALRNPVLWPVAVVREGSRATTVPLIAAGFLMMASYGFARPITNALFLEYFDSSDMLWGMALVPLVVTALLVPYGLLLSRFGPRRTLVISTILSGVLLAVPMLERSPSSVFFLYVWKEAYVVLLVEQFWAFANSSFSVEGGKKAYGPVLFVGGLGAVTGNKLVALLSADLGTWNVLSGSFLTLVPFVIFMLAAYQASPVHELNRKPTGPPKKGGHLGLGILVASPYLSAIGVVVGLGQVMAAALDVVFHSQMASAVTGLDARSAFAGDFWFYVNAGSMAMQLVTPLLLRLFSVGVLHLLMPLSHVAAVAALLMFPSLWTAAFAFAWFKILDYSLFRASKEVLYVPLDFDSRYRAKMVIDMVVYRTTKGGAALLLSLARQSTLALTALLPAAAGAAAALWTIFAWKIGNDFAKLKNMKDNSD